MWQMADVADTMLVMSATFRQHVIICRVSSLSFTLANMENGDLGTVIVLQIDLGMLLLIKLIAASSDVSHLTKWYHFSPYDVRQPIKNNLLHGLKPSSSLSCVQPFARTGLAIIVLPLITLSHKGESILILLYLVCCHAPRPIHQGVTLKLKC